MKRKINKAAALSAHILTLLIVIGIFSGLMSGNMSYGAENTVQMVDGVWVDADGNVLRDMSEKQSAEETQAEEMMGEETLAESAAEPDPGNAGALIGLSQENLLLLEEIRTSGKGSDAVLESLLTQIRNVLPAGNGEWAVYVSDLAGCSYGSINDHPMQAASLIKLYIMGAVYEYYEALSARYGQSTLDGLMYLMITVSDNDAANTLVSYLGGEDASAGMAVVNSFCTAHGYYNTSMGRLLLQGRENGDNYTSVEDCGHFLEAVYAGNSTEYPHADDMFELLKAQQRRNKIPAQLPPEAHVANKTGELSDVENDAAVFYDSGNDLAVVFMSEYLSDTGSAQGTIASISRQIFEYYTG